MKRLYIRHTVMALLGLLSMFSVTINAEPVTLEPRKIARQSGPTSNSGNPSAHLNSLSSSQDGNGKPMPTQQTGHQAQSYSRPNGSGGSQEYSPSQIANSNVLAQPQSTIYSHVQSSGSLGTTNQPASPSGGYVLSVNTQSGQPTALTQAPTPVLMQYLPQQQHQSANGVQFLQLIPTRPLIVPISPYISQPTVQTNSGQQYGQVGGQNYANAQNYVTAGQNYAVSGQRYLPGSPTSGQYPTYHATGALGSYGSPSAPIISFFRPHTGIQLVNGPVDMSLNTNEYIPIQGESAFKMRRA